MVVIRPKKGQTKAQKNSVDAYWNDDTLIILDDYLRKYRNADNQDEVIAEALKSVWEVQKIHTVQLGEASKVCT